MQFPNTEKGGWENEAQPSFVNRLLGVWKWNETLFRMFDIASQTITIPGEI